MRLLPREEGFFDLFEKQGELLLQTTNLLGELMQDFARIKEYGERFSDLEHEADLTTHEIIDKLNRTFVTPLEREDIHALAHNIDEIIDLLDTTVRQAVLYRVPSATPPMQELAEIVEKSCKEICKALGMLRHLKRPRRILDHCIEVNRLENEGDRVYRAALGMLVDQETDALLFIRTKEVYQMFEQIVDQCENVSNILEGIVVKNM